MRRNLLTRFTFVVLALALAVLGAGGLATTAAATPIASQQASPRTANPQYIESGSDNPVTAAPPVSRPNTQHCTQTLADHFLSNAPDGSPQSFSGTLSPPSNCKGPWTKVVLDYQVSVSGRQYDRVGDVRIGNTEVWWGTTEEPSGSTPTTYTVSKDITKYSALLRTPQPFHGGIGNYTSSVYTGNYDQTVTITYYQADRAHPAPAEPDAVVGLGDQQTSASNNTVNVPLSGLPRNITRAYLELTLEGHGCDEQWFSDVPDDVSAKYPSAGLCAHGPYREADVSLDGNPIASVHTFPHIYSGGIVPTLWRPIPAIDTFSLHSETVDVTPFVGRLVDGGNHQLTFTVANDGDTWDVVPTLLLYTDHHRATTSGAVTKDAVVPVAAQQTAEQSLSGGGTRATVTANRSDVTAGYVDTSAGRIYTTVTRTMDYRNIDSVTDNGLVQQLSQNDRGTQTSTSALNGRTVASARHAYDYPLSLSYSAALYVDDQNFSLSGTVDMTMSLSDSGTGVRPTQSSENVDSYGILARSNGVTSQSDGHSTSSFHGFDDNGNPYVHLLASDHGRVTKNVVYP
ncbi:MAG: hypothetical protein J2O49_02770 [Sciscionella sp.]|nr:hypothetical protein [Sciscionella sp.]